MRPAIITFAATGAELAQRLAAITGGVVHHCGHDGEDARTLLPRLFADGTPIVGICAAGILIRLLAATLADKTEEPPVLAVSQDGGAGVPPSAATTAPTDWPASWPRRWAATPRSPPRRMPGSRAVSTSRPPAGCCPIRPAPSRP